MKAANASSSLRLLLLSSLVSLGASWLGCSGCTPQAPVPPAPDGDRDANDVDSGELTDGGSDAGNDSDAGIDGGPRTRGFSFFGPKDVVGWPKRIVFDPSMPGVVYAGCDDTMGLYRSEDNGDTWKKVSAYGARSAWALDVDRTGRVYAGDYYGTGIRVITDGGATVVTANVGIAHPYISSISVDPVAPGVAYASAGIGRYADGDGGNGVALETLGAVYKTTNGGLSWSDVTATLDPVAGAIHRVYVNPGLPEVVYASSAAGIWVSFDGGVWTPAGGLLLFNPDNSIQRSVGAFDLVASPASPERLLASAVVATYDAGQLADYTFEIWRSVNYGASWTRPDAGPPAQRSYYYYSVAAHPTRDVYFAFGFSEDAGVMVEASQTSADVWSAISGKPQAPFFTGAFDPDPNHGLEMLVGTIADGVYRFNPDGGTWASSSSGMRGAGCDGLARIAGTPERWLVSCGNLSFGPVVASTTDRGLSWTRAGPTDLEFEGLGKNVLIPMLVDRQDPQKVYLGGDQIRRSLNGGQTWSHFGLSGLPAYSLAQAADGTVYAGGGVVSVAPTDGGAFAPMPAQPCAPVNFVHCDARPGGRLYASCPQSGFWSSDGTSWQQLGVTGAVAPEESRAIVADTRADAGHLAALTLSENDNAKGDRTFRGHIFVSTDVGASWNDVTPPLGCSVPHAVSYLSDAAGHLVVGTYSGDVTCPQQDGAIWESFDNGSTWVDATANLSPSHVFLNGLFEDPVTPGGLFVSTWYEGFLYRAP